MTDRTTDKLLDFASRVKLGDLPDAARTAAKARILSTLGVSLAAFDMEPIRIARRLAQPVAAGPCATIFGSLQTCAPDMAAFVNSAMVRSLDMSDTFVMAGRPPARAVPAAAFVNSAMVRSLDMSDTFVMAVSHPADAFPAALAVAEAEGLAGVGGAHLLLATAIAYEVQCRFVQVVPTSERGWDQTTVVALG